jgi:type IV secretion system protein VirB6
MNLVKFKIISLLLLLILNINASFGDFGDTCVAPPVSANYNDLKKDNVYGYVASLMDMKTYVPNSEGCNNIDGTITICLATPGLISQNPPCEKVKFSSGDKKKLFDKAVIGTQSLNHILKDVEFSADVINDVLCIFMPTSEGKLPVVCKKKGSAVTAPVVDDDTQYKCKISKSCYDPDANYSKTNLKFSGKAIHCVKETLDKILNPEEECLSIENKEFYNVNPFSYFQDSLKVAVRAALMMYIIFFGVRILLNPYKLELEEIVTAVLKVILVLYFSVGIGNIEYFSGGTRANDGITQFVLPLLLQIITDFPNMIFDASDTSTLCNFKASEYPVGFEFYSLWDSLDCRLHHYLGGQAFSMSTGSLKSVSALGKFDGTYSFAMVTLIFFMMLGGQIVLVLFISIFMIVLLSVSFFFISSYLVCLVSLYVMMYLAPIFIPMALFERTKGYFDAWLRISISFALQPMIFASFMAILMTFYDSAIYGNCQFSVEAIEGLKQYQFTSVSEECKKTWGYKLYDIYKNGKNIEEFNAVLFTVTYYKEAFNNGYLIMNTIFMTFLSLVFFFFSKIISQFAADLTGGAQTGALVMDPTLLMTKAKNMSGSAINKIKKIAKKKD